MSIYDFTEILLSIMGADKVTEEEITVEDQIEELVKLVKEKQSLEEKDVDIIRRAFQMYFKSNLESGELIKEKELNLIKKAAGSMEMRKLLNSHKIGQCGCKCTKKKEPLSDVLKEIMNEVSIHFSFLEEESLEVLSGAIRSILEARLESGELIDKKWINELKQYVFNTIEEEIMEEEEVEFKYKVGEKVVSKLSIENNDLHHIYIFQISGRYEEDGKPFYYLNAIDVVGEEEIDGIIVSSHTEESVIRPYKGALRAAIEDAHEAIKEAESKLKALFMDIMDDAE